MGILPMLVPQGGTAIHSRAGSPCHVRLGRNLMSEPVLKSHKWWLFCRVYAPLGMPAWFIFPAVMRFGGVWVFYPLFAFPLAIISFLMLSTLGAFRFDYSCFGQYKRTAWPAEKPILVVKSPHGRVGSVGGYIYITPGVWMWSLFSSGLGIRIPYCGRAFIPLDAIQEVRRPSWGFRTTLIHNSPELRNPISMPSKEIVEGIRQLIAKPQNARVQDAGP